MQWKPTVYLSGPIQHAQDYGKGWRQRVKAKYSDDFEFSDPWSKYPEGSKNDEILDGVYSDEWPDSRIMAEDRKQIDQCDALIIHWPGGTESFGTPREAEYVSEWGRGPDIPFVVQTTVERPSPWMDDALAIVETFDEAFEALREYFERYDTKKPWEVEADAV